MFPSLTFQIFMLISIFMDVLAEEMLRPLPLIKLLKATGLVIKT